MQIHLQGLAGQILKPPTLTEHLRNPGRMASRIAIRAGGEEEETGLREPINNQQLLPHICQDPERAETLCLKMPLLLGGALLPSSGFGALCKMPSKSQL